ncbi:MAG: beta-galactosidase [Ruminococcus sp.]|nr:beta-galactosidase [Ruminococcus sp.]MBQ8298037.1 beta-galactosidase [Ruminococcus sp.]
MRIGVDYYPEQWDKSLWRKDAELMAETGVSIVRLAEFAWSRLEPEEGSFDFSWLDEAVQIFSENGIEVVLCTPTNCPPLWLYEKHPEIIQTGADGRRIQIGIRGHRCINSSVFLEYAKRITDEMTRHYSGNSSVIAWQIDNELEAYPCCCEECRADFRNWLIEKYGTVDNINKAFGNSVWSGEYSSITQIQPPSAYPKAWQNPALCLDYWRFTSGCTAEYVRLLSSVIRKNCPGIQITTNTWFCENMPDLYDMFSELDFVSYDNYPPVRIPKNPDEFYSHAFHLDFMRGIKQQNFWIMEQLSGLTGSWAPMAPTPRPGQIKGYALQAIAHGADTVVHFRWRTAITGAEMHWHGILDHSGALNRRYSEFRELCKILPKLEPVNGAEIYSETAILYSPESECAFKIQPQTDGFYYLEQMKYFHAAFTKYGANIDVISSEADLSRYKIVIAPSLYVNNEQVTKKLKRYVSEGGTLVMTCRSGVKDENNNCIMDALPAVFKELVGAEVVEYDPIGWSEQSVAANDGKAFSCKQWCDVLKLNTAESLAEYADSFYKGAPAVTVNKYGRGTAYYIGTVGKMDFYEDFAGKIMEQCGLSKLDGLPTGTEITTRTDGECDYIFIFNNSENDVEINLPETMYSLMDSADKEKVKLKPFEMDVLRK